MLQKERLTEKVESMANLKDRLQKFTGKQIYLMFIVKVGGEGETAGVLKETGDDYVEFVDGRIYNLSNSGSSIYFKCRRIIKCVILRARIQTLLIGDVLVNKSFLRRDKNEYKYY